MEYNITVFEHRFRVSNEPSPETKLSFGESYLGELSDARFFRDMKICRHLICTSADDDTMDKYMYVCRLLGAGYPEIAQWLNIDVDRVKSMTRTTDKMWLAAYVVWMSRNAVIENKFDIQVEVIKS